MSLWWQAQHGWATIAMTRALNRENGGLGHIGTWVNGQLNITALTLAWVWVIGLWCLCRSRRPLWRALAWAYGLLFVPFAVTAGAKTYYLCAAYVYLLAAGTVAIDRWLRARPGRLRTLTLASLMLATAVLTARQVPLQLPVLPAADLAGTFYASNATPLETIGWPEFVRTVDAVWTSLPPGQRASAVIFTDDYGEAAAAGDDAGVRADRAPVAGAGSARRRAGAGAGMRAAAAGLPRTEGRGPDPGKSDPKDAVIIARLAAGLHRYEPERADAVWERVQHLGARRHQLTTAATAQVNQIRDLLECCWPGVLAAWGRRSGRPAGARRWPWCGEWPGILPSPPGQHRCHAPHDLTTRAAGHTAAGQHHPDQQAASWCTSARVYHPSPWSSVLVNYCQKSLSG